MPVEDANGNEIQVGQRVREQTMNFGDGLVESINVPIIGPGYNIGVRWDDPTKEGPTWTAEGGGRAGEHLIILPEVVEVQEEEVEKGNTTGMEWDRRTAFFARFGRDPLPEEEELGEDEWDEIERICDGGSGGGGSGGDDDDNDDMPPPINECPARVPRVGAECASAGVVFVRIIPCC